MVTCSACGGRYWPEDKESHLAYDCFPSPYHVIRKPAAAPAVESSDEKWRIMKSSAITPSERKALGLRPRSSRKSR